MEKSNTPGSVSGAIDVFQNAEVAALIRALHRRPPIGDPVPDWLRKILGEKELAQITAVQLESQVELEKQSIALAEQIFSHYIEQEKAAISVKELALTLIKEKL